MNEKQIIRTRLYESPCGTLLLGALGERLCLCDWLAGTRHERTRRRTAHLLGAEFAEGTSAVCENAAKQLDEYFAGTRRKFDIPLLFAGTRFQKTVWNALLQIPFGETISYGETAKRIGAPLAVRATANACGANAISVFVPCHRVVGGNHSLTGYAGGLPAKRFLLTLERGNALKQF